MNNEQQPYRNDDVDLLVIFNYIGERFNKLFRLIGWIFKSLFSIFIYASRAILDNIKLIAVALIVSAAIGYGLEKYKSPVYESRMIVSTFFDSKYQLASNLEYYNSLLGDENYSLLSSIFEIDSALIKKVGVFELNRGPQSENEKFAEYDEFLNSLDSIRAQSITFEDYIENRDIFTGTLFEIRVESKKKDIFNMLDVGIFKSFNNLYSLEKKKKRDSLINLRKENILNSIIEIDSLQNVYINVLEEESQSTKARINLGEGFPLEQAKSDTKEYQLLNKEIELRDELRELEEEKIEESELYEVISTFPRIGSKVTSIYDRYMLVLPLLTFLLLSFIYLIKKFRNYVINYEG